MRSQWEQATSKDYAEVRKKLLHNTCRVCQHSLAMYTHVYVYIHIYIYCRRQISCFGSSLRSKAVKREVCGVVAKESLRADVELGEGFKLVHRRTLRARAY